MQESWLREFIADWELSGKSPQTAREYVRYINILISNNRNPSLVDVKEWLQETPSLSVRRKRALSVRAFGRWSEEAGLDAWEWWRRVPLTSDIMTPQETVTLEIYRQVLGRCRTLRDRALIEVLWSTGLRRSEIARLRIEDFDLAAGCAVVISSKSKKPRVVPISPAARRAVRRLVGTRTAGTVFGMSGNAIRLCLRRLDAPSAHAWRRGWAVQALRLGVSESSVKVAAGWKTGAMVSRCTFSLATDIAVAEFELFWQAER